MASIDQKEILSQDKDISSNSVESNHSICDSAASGDSIEHIQKTVLEEEPKKVSREPPGPDIDALMHLEEDEFIFDNLDKEVDQSKNMVNNNNFEIANTNSIISNETSPTSGILDEDWRKGLLNMSPVCSSLF